jgi:hypothetical protein
VESVNTAKEPPQRTASDSITLRPTQKESGKKSTTNATSTIASPTTAQTMKQPRPTRRSTNQRYKTFYNFIACFTSNMRCIRHVECVQGNNAYRILFLKKCIGESN